MKTQKFGTLIWEKIEGAQGYAFISDAIEHMSDEEAKKLAEAHLWHFKRCVVILEKLLNKTNK